MNIIDCLYAYPWLGSDNNCNSYVFAGVLSDGKHVLIDPGHFLTPMYSERGLEQLLRGMARDGIDGAKIGLVILTHGHPDHCEAAILLRREHQSLVAIHEADEPNYSMMGGKTDIFLQEGILKLGSSRTVTLQILHSPGHTPGHVTVYWPDRQVLIAGDCIFYRSMGRTDFPGGDAQRLQRSIERMSKLDIEYVLCGHAYGNSGILIGKEEVQENFRFILDCFRTEAF